MAMDYAGRFISYKIWFFIINYNESIDMESLDYWRLCDEYTVKQAALLIVGEDPANNDNVENCSLDNQPIGYLAAKSALLNAISSKNLYADNRDAWVTEDSYRPLECLIKVDDLRNWLLDRGINKGFFFPQEQTCKPNYLDIKYPHYSPKLAAAIEAWLTVIENPELVKAKSVKQALMIYLRSHALRFGLIKDDGNPNEQGIEEIAKIANWESKGGAPKTPNES